MTDDRNDAGPRHATGTTAPDPPGAPDPLTDTGRHALITEPVEEPVAELVTPPAGFPVARRSSRRGTFALLGAGALVLALVAGAAGGWIGWSLAGRQPAPTGSLGQALPPVDPASASLTPVEAVAQKVLPSVVLLTVQGGGPGQDEGSGVVLSADGLVLTNDHVVAPAATGGTITATMPDGRSLSASIAGRAPASDIAVLRLAGASGLTPADLGNSDALRVGQQVVAIGAPLGLDGTVTTGIVGAVNRAVPLGAGQGSVVDAVQHDAPINPGNSGGPLTDLQGRVVGLNSAIASANGTTTTGVGFAIPVNQVRRLADELARTGQATRAAIGLTVTAAGRPASGGAVVGQVTADGPAARAGLHPGDVVLRVAGRPVADGDQLIAAVRSHAPGETVPLTLADRQVNVVLAAEPG